MKPPPLLLGAALLFWGWQTDLLPLGLGLALALESPQLIAHRLEVRESDFHRLWNFTTLLFLGTALVIFFAQDGLGTLGGVFQPTAGLSPTESLRRATQTALRFFHWLPPVFFPFVLTQRFSRTDHLPWRTFSLVLRRFDPPPPDSPGAAPRLRGIHSAYPFFLLTLFAATATRKDPGLYFAGTALLLTWALWPLRSRRYAPGAWATLTCLALALGYGAQYGFLTLAGRVQDLENRFWQRYAAGRFNPNESQTSIGTVGHRKLSGHIVYRVECPTASPPTLLREAAFTRFRTATWTATRREFQPVVPINDHATWPLLRGARVTSRVLIAGTTRQGRFILPLPAGTRQISTLPADTVETNRLGAAQAHGAPPLAAFTVDYSPASPNGNAPDPEDLDLDHLAPDDRRAVARTAQELQLAGRTPADAVKAVEQFFARNFSYSLYEPRRADATPETSPLETFLHERRSGHCEYFATATTLLLRSAGIPARYTVGYAVQERRGDQWIVRGRHAHAWCQAYLDGQWRDLDTTPGNWNVIEAARAQFWEPITDRFSQAWFAFRRWQLGDSRWKPVVFFTALGILGFLAWRQLRGSRWLRAQLPSTAKRRPIHLPGLDSEFYLLERRLALIHGPRPASEPLGLWLHRLTLADPGLHAQALHLLHLHYRYRFDPNGLTPTERIELKKGASAGA